MEIDVDRRRLDALLSDVLARQTGEVRAELVERIAADGVLVYSGEDGAAEWWSLVVAGSEVARVHRSRIERAPRVG